MYLALLFEEKVGREASEGGRGGKEQEEDEGWEKEAKKYHFFFPRLLSSGILGVVRLEEGGGASSLATEPRVARLAISSASCW